LNASPISGRHIRARRKSDRGAKHEECARGALLRKQKDYAKKVQRMPTQREAASREQDREMLAVLFARRREEKRQRTNDYKVLRAANRLVAGDFAVLIDQSHLDRL
jgi:hypothetical protein